MDTKTTDELVILAAAGVGFRIDARLRSPDELIRIAEAAAYKSPGVVFVGISHWPVTERARIVAAGEGRVSLED